MLLRTIILVLLTEIYLIDLSVSLYGPDNDLQEYELQALKKLIKARTKYRRDILHGDQLKFRKDRENIWYYGVIPYEFDWGFPPRSAKNLREMMDIFNNKTCVKFRPFRPKTDREWLYITSDASKSCYAERGRIHNGRNHANMPDSCVFDIPLALHNLMHVLGFYDQQQSPDRDNYVTIFWENIKEEGKMHFKMQNEMTDFCMPYDYHSVTHARPKDWMKSNQVVMRAKIDQVFFGPQTNKLSFQDIEKVNIFYEWECTVRYYKEFFMETDL